MVMLSKKAGKKKQNKKDKYTDSDTADDCDGTV
jgi:hypothetical protein